MRVDAVSVAPNVYSTLFENDRVRVLKISTEPGSGSETHGHPDMVVYAVTDCDWDLTTAEGEVVKVHVPAGDVFYQDATTHSAVDIGSTGSVAIAVELK